MNILTAQQMREWDQYTIGQEPVSSLDLMERAATECASWIKQQNWQQQEILIFCGKGNNGGDGLAIARMLMQSGYKVRVIITETGKPGSPDFETNLERFKSLSPSASFITNENELTPISSKDIVIDALFGTGLNKPLEGLAAAIVNYINGSGATVVSIDLPSGLFSDRSSLNQPVICADHTLSFQSYKTGLLVQENAKFIGQVHLLDIRLHPGYIPNGEVQRKLIDKDLISKIYRPRNAFAHKGNFGHALLVAGSFGKMGAAVLAAKACLHSGIGLLSCCVPRCGYTIMQASVPEAMVITDDQEKKVSSLPDEIEKYAVVGIGPGIGTADETRKLFSFITRRYSKPVVIDADGLNCLSLQKELLAQLPAGSVLTPHPKEFDRLFGDHQNDFDRIETARQQAMKLKIVLLLKGHHTLVASPEGNLFFNSTGNAGMAKGGSGDVLTGIITALVGQHYAPLEAAVFGVYLHGMAGDIAAGLKSQEAMTATDIIEALPAAFLHLQNASS